MRQTSMSFDERVSSQDKKLKVPDFRLDKAMAIKIQLTTVFLGFTANYSRSVAQLARASVSKTEGCGFETLHSCQSITSGYT